MISLILIVKITKKMLLILILFTKNQNLIGIFLKFLDFFYKKRYNDLKHLCFMVKGQSSLNSRALFFIGKGVGGSPSSGPNPNYIILSEGN